MIDSKGKYLMPGLAEMYAYMPSVNDLKPMKEVWQLFFLHVITTVQAMLGFSFHMKLRSKL